MRVSASKIASDIRQDIESGIPGYQDQLPTERALTERFGSARGTIRRALALLKNSGIITIKKSSGSFVKKTEVSTENLVFESARPLELMDVRFAFEPHICRLAVLNARKEDLDLLASLLEIMEYDVEDAIKFSELDTLFHNTIVETTGNALLVWIVAQINQVRAQQAWTKMRKLTLVPSIISQYNDQHRQIFDAIRMREPELAANHMKIHLEAARLSLTRAAST